MALKPKWFAGFGLAPIILLAGCASKGPPPLEELAMARSSVARAETAGAREAAALDLLQAREGLAKADAAVRREEFEVARTLAERAEVDARLAEAKARTAKAQNAVNALKAANTTLLEETERRRPAAPAMNRSGDKP